MKNTHSISDARLGPACAAFVPLLPLVSHGLLAPEETRRLQAHLTDCGYCRARLAGYDRLDGALRQDFEQLARYPRATKDIMNDILDHDQPGASEVPEQALAPQPLPNKPPGGSLACAC